MDVGNKLDLVKEPSTEVSSQPLLDMAKVGRGVAAIRSHRTPPSINSDTHGTLEHSVTSKPPSRRGSRLEGFAHRGPQIIIDPPPPEESLYPSLTTLGSLDEEEDEVSCKDCCRSGMTHVLMCPLVPRVCSGSTS